MQYGKKQILRVIILFTCIFVGTQIVTGIHSYIEKTRAQVNETICEHQLKVLGLPLLLYAKEHNGAFPSKWSELFPTYVKDVDFFICHQQRADYEKKQGAGAYPFTSPADVDTLASYVLVSGHHLGDDPKAILAYEPDGHHGNRGHAVLHVDTSAGWIRDGQPETR